MGIYQKFGVRKIALKLVDFVTWIRLFQFKSGNSVFWSLQKPKNGYFKIQIPEFSNPVYLRDNFSDKAIFDQVFFQQQYVHPSLTAIDAKYIIDAGANIGLASLFFSRQYPSAQIVALEPEKNNFELLKKNVASYPNITSLHAALWYKKETISIKNPDSLAASFMVESGEKDNIPAITIESILTDKGWSGVDILKIDIEGAEKEIFLADTAWLKKIKVLIIELHDNYKPDCTKTFFKAIESYNYSAIFHHENIFVFFNHI